MTEQRKQSTVPGVIGCVISVFLVISFLLPRIWDQNPKIEAANNILVIAILCLSVHMVRRTSALFVEHVWHKAGFLILWAIPVMNLLVIAIQLVWDNPVISRNVIFNIFLLLISLPAFCCYYFSVLQIYCKKDSLFRAITLILDGTGILYFIMRLTDKIILPLMMVSGHNVRSIIEVVEKLSPYFYFAIYILTFVNFIICIKLLSGAKENGISELKTEE